ncbi:hypothetical protein [Sphingopyxis lindanitolerans]|uniref:hypothetical protein n=1 Tax=Sphingopyxis lindanitolerans TaxID=2054227 RepID=UPI0011B22B86|nr:hypothetical protein [Sphingopyxis lindanitolerans]
MKPPASFGDSVAMLGDAINAFGKNGRQNGDKSPTPLRHAELVSASMAYPLALRCTEGNDRPWILKQVQGDEA